MALLGEKVRVAVNPIPFPLFLKRNQITTMITHDYAPPTLVEILNNNMV